MQLVIELDGPVIDPLNCYWHAYSQSAAELGLARLPKTEFWRRVRTEAPIGQWLPGSKPAKIDAFRAMFNSLLESDECQALQEPQEDIGLTLNALKRHGGLSLVTMGENKAARQTILDRNDLSIHFDRMTALSPAGAIRTKQLEELMRSDPRSVICASSRGLIQAASSKGYTVVGVGAGATVSKRLVQAGAPVSFCDMSELLDDIDSGSRQMIAAGMLPQRHEMSGSPFATPSYSRSRGRR